MATMVQRWLELAHELLEERPSSSGLRRRAVSTAYYAVFHTIARICADEIATDHDRSSAEYTMVYRSLEHAGIRNALTNGPLAENARLRRIGEAFKLLQEERLKADYMPPIRGVIEFSKARELLAEAEFVVEELEALSPATRQTLVVRLLIKDPKR